MSRKRAVFEKIAQKSKLAFHWLKVRIAISAWPALFTAGYPRVDSNVRNIYKRVNCTIEDLLETQSILKRMKISYFNTIDGLF